MATRVFFLLSQDGEPVQLKQEMAPKTPEASESSIRGLWAIGDKKGFPVTNVPHAQVAVAHAEMWKETVGNERRTVVLHSHPWKDKLLGYSNPLGSDHMGGLSEREQILLLMWGRRTILESTGILVEDFRSGNLSGNKTLHKALAAAGFTGSSCSAPGREKDDTFSSWPDAEPYPYWASSEDHLQKGSLRVMEFPQTMDLSEKVKVNGFLRHPDLSPDIDWPSLGHPYADTMRRSLERQVKCGNKFLYLSSLTHNHVDYSDDNEPQSIRVCGMLDDAFKVCADLGYELVPVTLTQAKKYFQEVYPYGEVAA